MEVLQKNRRNTEMWRYRLSNTAESHARGPTEKQPLRSRESVFGLSPSPGRSGAQRSCPMLAERAVGRRTVRGSSVQTLMDPLVLG